MQFALLFHCYFLITRFSVSSARQGSKTQTMAAVLLQSKPQAPPDSKQLHRGGSFVFPMLAGHTALGKQEQLYILSISVIRPTTFPGQFGQSALSRDLSQETETSLMSSLLNPGCVAPTITGAGTDCGMALADSSAQQCRPPWRML